MSRACEQQNCCDETPFYHCIFPVVSKAFLCSFDGPRNTFSTLGSG